MQLLRQFDKIKNLSLAILIVFCWQYPACAYIDPGTGSMLFSVVVGISATLFFLFNSLIIKLKMLLFSQKVFLYKDTRIPFLIYSEGRQYFNVFKPVLDEFEKRQIPLVFYTSSPDDPFFDCHYDYVKGEYIGKSFEAYLKLAFVKADVCLMTTPGLDVFQLKRSKYVKYYCHIFHAVTSSLVYRLFSLDYYDAVLCDAEFQIPMIREIESKRKLKPKELVVTGCTYMDLLAKRAESISKNNDDFKILVAPSWGENGILKKYGSNLLDLLAESDWNIVIRPHPQSLIVEKDIIENLKNRYKDKQNISWNFDVDNLNILSQADVLISDFSGIIFDYAFLFNRPFIYVNQEMNREIYDMSDLDEEPWRYKAIREIGTELTKDNFINIVSIIKNMSNNQQVFDAIQKAKNIAWQKQGESAKNVADFLIKKQKELS